MKKMHADEENKCEEGNGCGGKRPSVRTFIQKVMRSSSRRFVEMTIQSVENIREAPNHRSIGED